MAHNNGRIYIDPNTTGVEIADLQQVLGRGTGDLGLLCSDQEWYDNDGTPALRPVNRINKWAKFKPIKDSVLGVLTPSIRKNKNQGFVGFFFDTPTACFDGAKVTIDGSIANWRYERPVGGIGVSPFRIMDFANETDPTAYGYNHNALNPFSLEQVINDPADSDQDVKVEVQFYYTGQEIALSDLAAIDTFASQYSGTWYWCLFAKVPTQNYVQCWHLFTDQNYTTRLTIGSPSSSLRHGFTHFTCPSTVTGTVEAYLGLACIDDLVEPGHVRYVYVPVLRDASFNIVNPTSAFYVTLLPQGQSESGMVITYGRTGENNDVVAMASSFEIRYIGPGEPVIHIRERIYGYVNGEETGYEQRTSNVTITSSVKSAIIDGPWTAFEGVIFDDPLTDLKYSIQVQVGSSAYVYMYFNGSDELRVTDSEVRMPIGDLMSLNDQDYTYVELINNTPD